MVSPNLLVFDSLEQNTLNRAIEGVITKNVGLDPAFDDLLLHLHPRLDNELDGRTCPLRKLAVRQPRMAVRLLIEKADLVLDEAGAFVWLFAWTWEYWRMDMDGTTHDTTCSSRRKHQVLDKGNSK